MLKKSNKFSLDSYKNNIEIQEKFLRNQATQLDTASVFAPAVFSYVWWVLDSALKKEIRMLYFLARDGYLLYNIALRFCEKFRLPIQCKYLYCSRLSFRMPSYHIIGDEMYSLILNGGYQISPFIVFNRIGLTKEEREAIYTEIDLLHIDENKIMSKIEYKQFAEKVKQSKLFYSYIIEKSRSSYDNTIGYLKQEGLLDEKQIAIVDSGWTGSVQRTLRQLINSAGAFPKLVGFYFGLYEHSSDEKDGEYLSWYFQAQSSSVLKAKFNNNLFECLCSAPHEMTIGYERIDDTYQPIFQTKEHTKKQSLFLHLQLTTIETYTKNKIEEIDFHQLSNYDNLKAAKKSLQKLMVKPTIDQALEYKNYWFSDDVQESYYQTLTDRVEKQQWKEYLFFHRAVKKLTHNEANEESLDNLFWPYGSLVLSELKNKWFYRFNILFWDILRFAKMRAK